MAQPGLDQEGMLDVMQEIYLDEDQVKEYRELVKKTKMFVNVSVETGSPLAAVCTSGVTLLRTMEEIYKDSKIQALAPTIKKTLAELQAISTQLKLLSFFSRSEKDLEKSWKDIDSVMNNIKSILPQGIELEDIRKESQNDPRRGIESLTTKLQDIHEEYIAEQIKFKFGFSLLFAMQALWYSWTTFTILDQFSTAKEEYKTILQQVADTLTDVEVRVKELTDEFNQGLPVEGLPVEHVYKRDAVHELHVRLRRGIKNLGKAKSLLQANESSVSARRSEHLMGTVTSAFSTYRSISEYVFAASVGVNPFYQVIAAVSASLAGVSTLVQGTMAYKCQKAIAEANALLADIKIYENKFAKAANNLEEFLSRHQEKLNSKTSNMAKRPRLVY